jgi:putative ABC transport system ATP-binding protein
LPQLILADEPTSDLDVRTEREVMDILLDINSKGVTFLILTHNLELTHFATRAFEIDNGKLSNVSAVYSVPGIV